MCAHHALDWKTQFLETALRCYLFSAFFFEEESREGSHSRYSGLHNRSGLLQYWFPEMTRKMQRKNMSHMGLAQEMASITHHFLHSRDVLLGFPGQIELKHLRLFSHIPIDGILLHINHVLALPWSNHVQILEGRNNILLFHRCSHGNILNGEVRCRSNSITNRLA